jgi:hypothetical protein
MFVSSPSVFITRRRANSQFNSAEVMSGLLSFAGLSCRLRLLRCAAVLIESFEPEPEQSRDGLQPFVG